MTNPLSEQLADLSAHARSAEDAVAAAKKEARDKIAARREQVHGSAAALAEKVNQEIKSAKDASDAHWTALKAKVAADSDYLKSAVQKGKHQSLSENIMRDCIVFGA
jgi:hypothetical protein